MNDLSHEWWRDWYRLEGKTPVRCTSIGDLQLGGSHSRVGLTVIGETRISTVFLGIDHGHGGAQPVLFETMIFGGEHDQYCERYCTWDEAAEGHLKACELVRQSQ